MYIYQQKIEEVIKQLNSKITEGLSDDANVAARRKYGSNILKATNRVLYFKKVCRHFISPLIVILFFATLLFYYIGQFRDGTILLAILVLNALIEFYQEWKSENILASLNSLVVDRCNVFQNGKLIEIISSCLVPSNIVQMNEGYGILADIRLISTTTFSVNEFSLTLLSRRTDDFVISKYLFSNCNLLIAFALSHTCILFVVYNPILNLCLHTAPLHSIDWLLTFSSAIACLIIYEAHKYWKRKKLNKFSEIKLN